MKTRLKFFVLCLVFSACRSKYQQFHDNKTVAVQGFYKNDSIKTGHWMYYNDKGKLDKRGSFKNGKRNGFWVFYDEFSEYGGLYKNGSKEGEWTNYGEFKTYGPDGEFNEEENEWAIFRVIATFKSDSIIKNWAIHPEEDIDPTTVSWHEYSLYTYDEYD